MLFRWTPWIVAVAGCGGGSRSQATMPTGPEIQLVAGVAAQTWYRSPTICGQGPYEIDVPIEGVKWGEQIELRLTTPRRIAVHAMVLADGAELQRTAELFDAQGVGRGKADNLRCIADARQRHAAVGGGGGGGGGGVTVPDVPVGTTIVTPPAGDADVRLQIDAGPPPLQATEVVRVRWREHDPRPSRIRIRLWSIEPNDLDGVRFGVVRYAWRPNVPEAEYEAHLARLAEAERRRAAAEAEELRRRQEAARVAYEAELQRRHEQRRRALEQEQRELEERRRNPAAYAAELERLRREREAALRAQAVARREAEERERKAAEAARRAEAERQRRAREAAEQRQLEIAIKLEQERQRAAFCASHPDDRGCWGAGGKRVYLQLEARAKEREAYCAAHRDDARCWTDAERTQRQAASRARVEVALAPPKQPDGPPPPPRTEDIPPKLSVNAEWRPGYWQWTGTTWAWLGGMWRVPEQDIVAELTTTAPSAPPPPRVEVIPPPPMTTTVWVEGFWQWSGSAWVWVAGSYQARPEVGVVWRPTAWRPRGRVHVLVPGAWVPRASRTGGRR